MSVSEAPRAAVKPRASGAVTVSRRTARPARLRRALRWQVPSESRHVVCRSQHDLHGAVFLEHAVCQ